MKSSIILAVESVTEGTSKKLDRDFLKYASDKYKPRLENLLPKLEAALSGEDIWNVDWVDLKDILSRVFDAATSQIGAKFGEARKKYKDEHPDFRDLVFGPDYEYFSGYPHMVPQKLKKLKTEKTRKTFREEVPYVTDELYQQLIKVYEEFESVAAAMKETKDKVKKGRQPNPDAKPTYVPPMSSKASLKMIQDKVEEVTQSMYESLVKSYQKYFEGMVDLYFTSRKKEEDSPYSVRALQGLASIIGSFLTNVPKGQSTARYNDPYRKHDDYEKRIEKASREQADIVRDRYKLKMMAKLGSIVGKKAEKGVALKSVGVGDLTARSGTFEGWMKFEFEDGSKFNVLNKVVTKWSQRGQAFHQFPTTFHDVKFHNDKTYKMRSEEEMNTEFIEGGIDKKE